MRVPTGVWKAVTHLVAVVASFLLVLVFTAVLPLGLGSVVLLGMILVVGLVAGGELEGPAVRLATRAGAPTDGELQVLSTVPDLGERHRVLVPGCGVAMGVHGFQGRQAACLRSRDER